VLHHLFHLDISYWEKAVRTVAVYGGLVLLLRLGGKRMLAQLNAFDLVVQLLLSNVVQNAVIGPDDSLLGGLVGAVVLLAANYVLVSGSFRWPWLQGRERVLVADGEPDEQALRSELITANELDVALRRQGYDGVAGVSSAWLVPEGTLVGEKREDPVLERIERRLTAIEAKLG
jgi:uncharacterized membrane protein YcaP (DUF421 family)